MENKAFYNSDGDLLIVPQLGALRSVPRTGNITHERSIIYMRAHTQYSIWIWIYMDMYTEHEYSCRTRSMRHSRRCAEACEQLRISCVD